jgi:choline dehydrogenase-like flavoprotein
VNLLEYALFRSGPLASNVFEATGFIRSLPGLPRPDVQVVFQAARRNRNAFPFPLGHGFAISIVGLYPKSRGRVRLASKDPQAAPLVDPQLLSHPDDVDTMLRGLKIGRQVTRAAAFARYRALEVQPGTEVTDDAGLIEYVRRAAGTVHHPCGSCRMGPDATAVVDERLCVRGIESLAVVMIAEKAADMIRGIPALRPLELRTARFA